VVFGLLLVAPLVAALFARLLALLLARLLVLSAACLAVLLSPSSALLVPPSAPLSALSSSLSAAGGVSASLALLGRSVVAAPFAAVLFVGRPPLILILSCHGSIPRGENRYGPAYV
jgi:hypothetical protein